MTKAELRKQFLAQRRALSVTDVQTMSQQITKRFFDILLPQHTSLLHTFLPIARQNEVDTWPIIRRLWRDLPQVNIAVSITDTNANGLTHYVLTPETVLVENRWGIPEPVGNGQSAVDSQQIDVVLVPLLAFGKNGHRVGYGKGYYDRFLAECRPNCLKIGLSLFEPVEQIEDVEPTDVPLHVYLTPEASYVFFGPNSFVTQR
ncbi:5-formyltetrahydrofolate cyclo-ligase [Spirosoma montaniterrae]|uniref:5-formyltetrahydrofolate cyclo-ligase n=1 Tax=Spirosoma montaniterrae TaxID=1178516 RepID=A0A1P9WZY4_9BACT|nr:5-formyltetrahydrofolate cyclo-ligase [Spirosoma montaniterrae]AQG80947.1 5-formyltetrahydrofolate cyclo-ligase [Spirosoma montaniterrae]